MSPARCSRRWTFANSESPICYCVVLQIMSMKTQKRIYNCPEVCLAFANMSRISRMTAKRLDELKNALTEVGVDYVDALKKEYVDYVNGLSDIDYEKGDLAFHADAFAKTKITPSKVTESKPQPKETKKESRIPRISPKNLESLKKELRRVGVEQLDDKKTLDGLKAQFRSYVDALTDDDYMAHDLLGHMEAFAKSLTSTATPPESIPELGESDIEQIPYEEIEKYVDRFTRGLLPNKTIAYDTQQGKWVGPAEDDDEWNVEVTHDGVKYVVGEKTKRIYRVNPDGIGDVFLGFAGIGKFKHIKLPESDDEAEELNMNTKTLKV